MGNSTGFLSSVSVLSLPCRPAGGFAGLGCQPGLSFREGFPMAQHAAAFFLHLPSPSSLYLHPCASEGACARGSSFSHRASLCHFTKLMVQQPWVFCSYCVWSLPERWNKVVNPLLNLRSQKTWLCKSAAKCTKNPKNFPLPSFLEISGLPFKLTFQNI